MSTQVCGEDPSAGPLVRVKTIIPVPANKASSVVKEMDEEEVTLLVDAEDAGVTEEKVGGVVSQPENVQALFEVFVLLNAVILPVISETLTSVILNVPLPDHVR